MLWFHLPDTGLPGAPTRPPLRWVNDYVLVQQVTDITDNVSLAAWVKWAGPNGHAQFIVNNGNTGANGYGLFIRTNGTLTIINGGVGFVNSTTQLPINTWQHVAAVRENGVWKLYLNGVALAVTAIRPECLSGQYDRWEQRRRGGEFLRFD